MKISEIYKDVTTVWDSNKDIVIFHVVLYIILVFWFGVTFSFPELNLDKIATLKTTKSDYYDLFKDSGILVAIPAFIILILLIYLNLVKSIGGFLASNLSNIIPFIRPKRWFQSNYYSSQELALLASLSMTEQEISSITNEDQTINENEKRELFYNLMNLIDKKIRDLCQRFQYDYPKEYEQYLSSSTQDRWNYYTSTVFFTIIWIILFSILPPNSEFISNNKDTFTSVLVYSLIASTFFKYMAEIPLYTYEVKQLVFVVNMCKRDEETRKKLERRSNEIKLLEEKINWNYNLIELYIDHNKISRPSLLKFACSTIKKSELTTILNKIFIPVKNLYREGQSFCYTPSLHNNFSMDKKSWIQKYLAYIFYLFINGLNNLIRTIFNMITW